ncbi:MAG: dihydrodipicolinate synthase family protein [Armatimonadetes bacterium]|nr:dihydrodipicolinate synthase family protein [Armatimonadota bacterium]
MFSGIIPPIATPLNEKEEVDETAMRNLVRYLLQAGVHGIFVLGSTGEFAHLTDKEKQKVIEIAVSEVNSKVPVLVGVTESGTKRSIFWAKEAEKFKADGVVAAPPFYFPLNDLELENHYRALSSECGLPILLYHIPSTTKVKFSVELIERLSELPNIVGIKDSTGNLPFLFALIDKMIRKNFVIFQGHDLLLAPTLLYGAHGGINSLSNLVPSWFVALYESVKRNDAKSAFEWQRKINRLARQMEKFPFLPALKAALNLKGLIAPFVTLPFAKLTEEQRERLIDVLKDEGVM